MNSSESSLASEKNRVESDWRATASAAHSRQQENGVKETDDEEDSQSQSDKSKERKQQQQQEQPESESPDPNPLPPPRPAKPISTGTLSSRPKVTYAASPEYSGDKESNNSNNKKKALTLSGTTKSSTTSSASSTTKVKTSFFASYANYRATSGLDEKYGSWTNQTNRPRSVAGQLGSSNPSTFPYKSGQSRSRLQGNKMDLEGSNGENNLEASYVTASPSTRANDNNNAIETGSFGLLGQGRQKRVISFSNSLSYRNPFSRSFQGAKSTIGIERPEKSPRSQVERALREQKIFTCLGCYPGIRKALQRRGWVEKNPSVGQARSYNFGASVRELNRNIEDESDSAWINRVLRDYPPDFIWVIQRDNIDWRGLHKDQIINRYPKAFFTSKVGIATCLQNMQWYSDPGVSETYFPRCYRLCIDEEKTAFIDDFRLTACMSLLKWVVGAFEKDGEKGVIDPYSPVDTGVVDFAIRQVNNYVRLRRHEDIDWLMPPHFMGTHWESFLSQYYATVILKGKLCPSSSDPGQGETGKIKHDAAKRALRRIAPFWPQLSIDGCNNIWIIKPGARSRGKGIVLMNQLDKILELLAQTNFRDSNWVVQKYIERPLLVYNTKFDIRQWFLVTDWSPLTVWFYKESYIRFCSKPFSIEDFHESIHLCNNAVQCRYRNSDLRDPALPAENMWDNYTFMAYLKTLGKMDLWESVIYPGMKQGIMGIMLASQDSVESRKSCFELYGADFMLSEPGFVPWLIEINSCPCMANTTSVTSRMCHQCLEDVIKVVVDRRENKLADTGLFELVYKQSSNGYHPLHYNHELDIGLYGQKLKKDIDWPAIINKNTSKTKPANIRFLRSGPIIPPIGTRSASSNNGADPSESGAISGPGLTFNSNSLLTNHAGQSTTGFDPGHKSSLTFRELVQRVRERDQERANSDDFDQFPSPGASPMSCSLIPIAPMATPSPRTPEARLARLRSRRSSNLAKDINVINNNSGNINSSAVHPLYSSFRTSTSRKSLRKGSSIRNPRSISGNSTFHRMLAKGKDKDKEKVKETDLISDLYPDLNQDQANDHGNKSEVGSQGQRAKPRRRKSKRASEISDADFDNAKADRIQVNANTPESKADSDNNSLAGDEMPIRVKRRKSTLENHNGEHGRKLTKISSLSKVGSRSRSVSSKGVKSRVSKSRTAREDRDEIDQGQGQDKENGKRRRSKVFSKEESNLNDP